MLLTKTTVFTFASIALFAVCAGTLCAAEKLPEKTELDDYITAEDNSYAWKVIKEEPLENGKSIVIDMNSQTWRDESEVDRTLWQHWLTLTVPDEAKSNIGMLFIGGGRNGRDPPNGSDEIIQRIAQATGTVVAELHMVPNQPLVFHNDGERRSEDDLIGYTWDQYLKTGDPTWPARNPMVKSAVRAMDTITALTSEEGRSGPTIDKFVVAGGSKRGWTTWLTGAVDPRVVGIVPIVIDVLNVQEAVKHHFGAYGFFAPSVGDYVEHGLTRQNNNPRILDLYKLVDPYYYRHRLNMPKYIVNASGDQFFPPDSSQFYFDKLNGKKYLRYVPNADHSLDDTDAVESVAAFYSLILMNQEAPRFTWNHTGAGQIEVKVEDPPREVRLWHATNPDARDFRMESLGPKYESQVLKDQGDGLYVAEVPTPGAGWTAYFVELTYVVAGKMPLKLTTDVRVIPDILPHEGKDSTLPPTITVQCTCPSEAEAESIALAAAQGEIPGSDDPVRVASQPGDNGSDAVMLSVNWSPAGRFEASAKAVLGWLTAKKCRDFAYRLESGWFLPEAP